MLGQKSKSVVRGPAPVLALSLSVSLLYVQIIPSACVYLVGQSTVTRPGSDETLAIKCHAKVPDDAGGLTTSKRCRDELSVLSALRERPHPHLMYQFAVSEEVSHVSIMMPFGSGGDLMNASTLDLLALAVFPPGILFVLLAASLSVCTCLEPCLCLYLCLALFYLCE